MTVTKKKKEKEKEYVGSQCFDVIVVLSEQLFGEWNPTQMIRITHTSTDELHYDRCGLTCKTPQGEKIDTVKSQQWCLSCGRSILWGKQSFYPVYINENAKVLTSHADSNKLSYLSVSFYWKSYENETLN